MQYAGADIDLKCIIPPQTPIATLSQSPTETPSQSPTKTPTDTPVQPATDSPIVPPTEPPPTEIIVVDENVTETKRYEKVVNDSTAVVVNIKVTNFTDIGHYDVGGAVHIVNSGIKCDGLSFSNCSSTVAGGSIYINNTYDYTNLIELVDLNFVECEAKYGGAVYICSESRKNKIQILQKHDVFRIMTVSLGQTTSHMDKIITQLHMYLEMLHLNVTTYITSL